MRLKCSVFSNGEVSNCKPVEVLTIVESIKSNQTLLSQASALAHNYKVDLAIYESDIVKVRHVNFNISEFEDNDSNGAILARNPLLTLGIREANSVRRESLKLLLSRLDKCLFFYSLPNHDIIAVMTMNNERSYDENYNFYVSLFKPHSYTLLPEYKDIRRAAPVVGDATFHYSFTRNLGYPTFVDDVEYEEVVEEKTLDEELDELVYEFNMDEFKERLFAPPMVKDTPPPVDKPVNKPSKDNNLDKIFKPDMVQKDGKMYISYGIMISNAKYYMRAHDGKFKVSSISLVKERLCQAFFGKSFPGKIKIINWNTSPYDLADLPAYDPDTTIAIVEANPTYKGGEMRELEFTIYLPQDYVYTATKPSQNIFEQKNYIENHYIMIPKHKYHIPDYSRAVPVSAADVPVTMKFLDQVCKEGRELFLSQLRRMFYESSEMTCGFLFTGPVNTGKSTIKNWLTSCVEDTGLVSHLSSKSLFSKFNGSMNYINIIDDSMTEKNPDMYYDTVKEIITGNRWEQINKGSDGITQNYYRRIFMFTNHMDEIHIPADDDKIIVFKTEVVKEGDYDKDILSKLKAEIPMFLEYLRQTKFFENVRTDRFGIPVNATKSVVKDEIIKKSSPVYEAVESIAVELGEALKASAGSPIYLKSTDFSLLAKIFMGTTKVSRAQMEDIKDKLGKEFIISDPERYYNAKFVAKFDDKTGEFLLCTQDTKQNRYMIISKK